MKVIGETKEGYIVEVSSKEMANLHGFYSSYSTDAPKVKVGAEISIEEVYHKYTSLEHLIKSNDFSKMIEDLNKAIKLITPYEDLLSKNTLI